MKFKLMALALVLVMGLGMDAFAARTTRDLVFDEDEDSTPAQEQSGNQTVGVKTTVVLTRDGQTSTVAPSYEFKSGDKVKMVFTPNVDGYVYWLTKGSSGKYAMLFPSPQAGSDNSVKRNQEYTVPVKGAFKFDSNPGDEELLCILSTEKLTDLDEAAAKQFKDGAAQVDQVQKANSSKRTTRDLVFDEDEDEDVSTKTQTGPKGEPFVSSYVLKHN